MITREVVDYHLGRLDTAGWRSLVVDLWAARGFETSVEGNVVVATRCGIKTVIYPIGRRQLGSQFSTERPIDVVVAATDDQSAATVTGDDVRVLDTTDLRKMLLYSVNRETTIELCERHLGASPGQLCSPLHTRVHQHLRTPTARGMLLAATLVFLLGFGATTLVLSDAPGSTTTSPSQPSDPVLPLSPGANEGEEGDTPPAADTPNGRQANSNLSPPGVTREGEGLLTGQPASYRIVNLSALAVAHDRAIKNRSYTLDVVLDHPRDWKPDAVRLKRHMEIAVRANGTCCGRRYKTLPATGDLSRPSITTGTSGTWPNRTMGRQRTARSGHSR